MSGFDGNGYRVRRLDTESTPVAAEEVADQLPLPTIRPPYRFRRLRGVIRFFTPYLIVIAALTGLGYLTAFINHL